MKIATNVSHRKLSFPAAAISFKPGEIKTLSDDVASLLKGNSSIKIKSVELERRPDPIQPEPEVVPPVVVPQEQTQPTEEVAEVELNKESVIVEERSHRSGRRSRKIISDNINEQTCQ